MIHDGLILYHGSYHEILVPDLKYCRDGKDFGKGFYLTSSKRQAEKFTRTAVIKARRDGLPIADRYGVVSVFKVESLRNLRIFEFKDADRDWLHCVVAYRKKGVYSDVRESFADYDVMIGKIANDNTNLVITAYMDGVYGDIPSERADAIAISFLEPENLKDQFCFRSEAALNCLSFLNSYEVTL